MAISFSQVPPDVRTPGVLVEFDASLASQGAAVQPYQLLAIGQRLSTGTVAELVPTVVTSEDQARTYFGAGSMLHGMVRAIMAVNRNVTKLVCVAQDDDAAAVAATGTITVSGTATAAGTIALMIAGQQVRVAVASGDDASTVAAAIDAALDLEDALPVTSGAVSAVVTLTARNKGVEGNSIDFRHSYYEGEALPAGISLALVAMSGGTTNPDVDDVWPVLGETHYNVLAVGYADTGTIGKLDLELADRWGPLRQIEGWAFVSKHDTLANLLTYGDGENSQHVAPIGAYKAPHPPWEWAATLAGIVARYGQADPARPFQRRTMGYLLPPDDVDQFTRDERDLLLKDGVGTFTVDAGGRVLVERVITFYQETAGGAPSTAFLDVNTGLNLGYQRWDFRRRMLEKYPNHKLADDGTRFGAGQKIVTPKIGRAEALAAFQDWEELGLVEGFAQFKADLVVERNATDPNRLDFLFPTDQVNQLRVVAGSIQFRL